MTATICILSAAPIWVNPRVRKEADTLLASGYDVVVGYRADGDITRDDAILGGKRWRWHRVDLGRERERGRWLAAALRQRGAEWLVRAGIPSIRIARAAYCRGDDEMLEWAKQQRASLYIAHTQPTLAVAAEAARASGSAFAFDCEDLLAEEAADGGRARWRRDLIVALERRFLPRAAYVSATSEPMAAYLRDAYGLHRVPVWHNCFPAAESAELPPPRARPKTEVLSLAWISATIGPGRGLEDIFSALTRVTGAFSLHLYGAVPEGASRWLADQMGRVPRDVVVHPMPAPPQVMATLSQHHLGLTLDGIDCLNRSLTICNKLFLYLQAGLACVATDTPGQRSVLPPDAAYGAVYPPGDVAALVAVLERFSSPAVRLAAQEAAWQIGQQRYVWEAE